MDPFLGLLCYRLFSRSYEPDDTPTRTHQPESVRSPSLNPKEPRNGIPLKPKRTFVTSSFPPARPAAPPAMEVQYR